VPADGLLDEALAEATAMAELSSGAVARTKQAARGAIAEAFLAGLDADLGGITGPS
jgi:hypothetical protein